MSEFQFLMKNTEENFRNKALSNNGTNAMDSAGERLIPAGITEFKRHVKFNNVSVQRLSNFVLSLTTMFCKLSHAPENSVLIYSQLLR